MWLSLIVLGVLLTLAIWLIERHSWTRWYRWPLAGVAILIFGVVAHFTADSLFLGGPAWYDRAPWREIVLFLLMAGGMAARVLSVAIDRRRAHLARGRRGNRTRRGLQLDAWEFAYPFLFSVMTFGALMSQAGERQLDLAVVVLAFQTGFFWQTIIHRERPDSAEA